MARRNLIAARAGCFMGAGVAPQKARAREVGASTDDRALAPQSDHQDGPPQSDCGAETDPECRARGMLHRRLCGVYLGPRKP